MTTNIHVNVFAETLRYEPFLLSSGLALRLAQKSSGTTPELRLEYLALSHVFTIFMPIRHLHTLNVFFWNIPICCASIMCPSSPSFSHVTVSSSLSLFLCLFPFMAECFGPGSGGGRGGCVCRPSLVWPAQDQTKCL